MPSTTADSWANCATLSSVLRTMASVDWLEIDISGQTEQLPYLEVALIDMAFPGWLDLSAEQAEGLGCYRVYLAQEGTWEMRLQRLLEEVKELGLSARATNTIRDEDWAENWKKFYHPLEVGRSLVICPSWEIFQPRPDQHVVTLDPGSAFGTGYHPTTQLCLELLEQHLSGDLKNHVGSLRVLDLGCGSGILALAAWRLGVRQLWAVDVDPVAVKVARENFDVNGVAWSADGPLPRVVESDGFAGLGSEGFDLVVANLIASVLIDLAPRLIELVRPPSPREGGGGWGDDGGHLIVGGIIDLRHEEVRQALCDAGFRLVLAQEREDWYSMHLCR